MNNVGIYKIVDIEIFFVTYKTVGVKTKNNFSDM